MTNLPNIFRDCCGEENSSRWNFHRPFSIGVDLYATDGRIVVRTEGAAEPLENHPRADDLEWGDHLYVLTADPLPTLAELLEGSTPCIDCDGRGTYVRQRCVMCEGIGKIKDIDEDGFDTDVDITCFDCKGAGLVPKPEDTGKRCPTCIGTGVTFAQSSKVEVGTFWMARIYATLLRRNHVYEVRRHLKGKGKPFLFKGEGFTGLLMPVNAAEPVPVSNAQLSEARP